MAPFKGTQHNDIGYYLVGNAVWNINNVAELVYD